MCGINQVMAIATLDRLANNSDAFTGVLKIRKGQALRLLMDGEDEIDTAARVCGCGRGG